MALRIDPWKPPGANDVEMAAVIAVYRQGLAAQKPPVQKSAASARNEVEDWFKVPKTAGLIARSAGDKVEGILFFRAEPPVVRILYVSTREHRKGVGTLLVKAIRDLCAKKGIKEIRAAWSAKDEAAAGFFAKMGFASPLPAGEVAPAFPRVEAALVVPAAAPSA